MAKRNQHVIPLGNGWAVKKEGSNRFTVITDTQRDAIKVAREIAKSHKSELIVHGRDGKIMEKDSYENFPHPAKLQQNQTIMETRNGLKPGPKRIADSTGKPDRRQRDNKDTPGNTPSLKPPKRK
jgi:hypothetical protein